MFEFRLTPHYNTLFVEEKNIFYLNNYVDRANYTNLKSQITQRVTFVCVMIFFGECEATFSNKRINLLIGVTK